MELLVCVLCCSNALTPPLATLVCRIIAFSDMNNSAAGCLSGLGVCSWVCVSPKWQGKISSSAGCLSKHVCSLAAVVSSLFSRLFSTVEFLMAPWDAYHISHSFPLSPSSGLSVSRWVALPPSPPRSSHFHHFSYSFTRTDYPTLLWHPFFSVLKHKWMVYIQGSLPISEINKPDANVKMARCSIVSDVTAVERQQTVWGQLYACGTHYEALAKSNLISFTQILSICVYRILLNCRKQSPIYKFADFFSGPLPNMNLLIDLPTCSHSQLVTYWHLLRIPWRHFLTHCVPFKLNFFNVQVTPLPQWFALCIRSRRT